MTATNPLLVGPAERSVALGMFAVRPVVYLGETTGGPFAPAAAPIEGLIVRSTRAPAIAPLLHLTTNLYGFVGAQPGSHRIHIVDPRGRYLPRAIEVNVPDRRPLGAAILRGAAVLPPVDDPPLSLAWLRPAPGAVYGSALFGLVHDTAGAPLPLAWIRVETPDGRFVTYSDARGEYLAPLPFVRQPSSADPMVPTPPVSITVRAHRLLAPAIAETGMLGAFPAQFDNLAPETPGFDAFYDTTAPDVQAVAIEVGTPVRLDLQPA